MPLLRLFRSETARLMIVGFLFGAAALGVSQGAVAADDAPAAAAR